MVIVYMYFCGISKDIFVEFRSMVHSDITIRGSVGLSQELTLNKKTKP